MASLIAARRVALAVGLAVGATLAMALASFVVMIDILARSQWVVGPGDQVPSYAACSAATSILPIVSIVRQTRWLASVV